MDLDRFDFNKSYKNPVYKLFEDKINFGIEQYRPHIFGLNTIFDEEFYNYYYDLHYEIITQEQYDEFIKYKTFRNRINNFDKLYSKIILYNI